MSEDLFGRLLGLVHDDIAKQDTVMRAAISPKMRLQVTLRFLASGDSYRSLEDVFRLPKNTICQIVNEVMPAIWNRLAPKYVKCPRSPDEWKAISEEFF